MERVKPGWILGVLLLIALGVLYFSPWVEVARDLGFTDAAHRNPYLAAESFIGEFDVEVRTRDGLQVLDELPPSEQTLLLSSSRRSLSERRSSGLLDWVRDGGRLIVVARDLWDFDIGESGDELLDELGVQLHETENTEAARVEETSESFLKNLIGNSQCDSSSGFARIQFSDEEQAVAIASHLSRFLSYDGEYEVFYAESEVGPQLLYINVGDGAVVVLTTLGLWRNTRIGCVDHAHLLRWLTEDRSVLWWLSNTEMDALPILLWQRWPLAIILTFVLFGLWAWRGSTRVLTPGASERTKRRQLMEHIDGIARFRWQQRDATQLVHALRGEVLKGSSIKSRDGTELQTLARNAGVSLREAQRVLFDDLTDDSRDFTNTVKSLQRLRLQR